MTGLSLAIIKDTKMKLEEDLEAREAALRRQELQSILDKEMSALANLLHAAGAPVLKLELHVHLALDTDAGTSVYNVLLEQDLNSNHKTCRKQEQPVRNRKRKNSMPMKFGAKQTPIKCEAPSTESKDNEDCFPSSYTTSSNFPSLSTVPGTSYMMLVDQSSWNNSLQSSSITLTPMTSPIKMSTSNGNGSVTVSSANNHNTTSYALFNVSSKAKLPLRPLRASFPVTESIRTKRLSAADKKDSENPIKDEHTKSSAASPQCHSASKTRKISRRFTCQQCHEVFPALNALTKHTLAVHGRFRCSECGEAFTQKSNMERHFLKHQNFKPFRCAICNKAYYRKDHAARHVETSHIGHDSRMVVEKLDELGNRHAAPNTTIRLPAGFTPDNQHATVMSEHPVVLTGEAAEAAAAAELAATAADMAATAADMAATAAADMAATAAAELTATAAAALAVKNEDVKSNISDTSERESLSVINLSFGQ